MFVVTTVKSLESSLTKVVFAIMWLVQFFGETFKTLSSGAQEAYALEMRQSITFSVINSVGEVNLMGEESGLCGDEGDNWSRISIE